MKRYLSILLQLFASAVLALSILCCGGGGGGDSNTATGDTGPTFAEVAVTGAVIFPDQFAVNMDDVKIGFGTSDTDVDTLGEFETSGLEGVPCTAAAYDQSDESIMLLAVVPDPHDGTNVILDSYSTALALALLNPPLLTSDPDEMKQIISVLERLPEFYDFEFLLYDKLNSDPKILSKEDAEIDQALVDLLSAFVDYSMGSSAVSGADFVRSLLHREILSIAAVENYQILAEEGELFIDPPSGWWQLWIERTEGTRFDLFNGVGRWAICTTPTDEFWVFPNGTMLDVVKGKGIFPPSKQTFTLDLKVNDPPKEVNVYGFGFAPYEDNSIYTLHDDEFWKVLKAGTWTVGFEFIPHLISVINGLPYEKGWKKVSDNKYKWTKKEWYKQWKNELKGNRDKQRELMYWLETFLKAKDPTSYPKTLRIADRLYTYITSEEYQKMVWFVSKMFIKKLGSDQLLLGPFLRIIGIKPQFSNISSTKLTRMIAATIVLRNLVLADSYGSFLKTFLGFWQAKYKSPFKISKVLYDFGYVNGEVRDKETNLPIEGAIVTLTENEDNPHSKDESGKKIIGFYTKTTGSNGSFLFEKILAGTKEITASKAGYRSGKVSVMVEKNGTAMVDIYLEKEKGAIKVKIQNEILKKHNQNPTFLGQVTLDIRGSATDGTPFSKSVYVYNGEYSIDLRPGNYTIMASHEDYEPDSVDMKVLEDLTTQGLRDLLLKPIGYMKGTIYLDMNNDGAYETSVPFDMTKVGAYLDKSNCGQTVVTIQGVSGPDRIGVVLSPAIVTDAMAYDLNAAETVGCPGGPAAALVYITSRVKCKMPPNYQDDMIFFISGDPGMVHCNCGIADPGDIYFDADKSGPNFGTSLTNDLTGFVPAGVLAGWNTCSCAAPTPQDPGVDCARARIDLDEFKALVGTQYKLQ